MNRQDNVSLAKYSTMGVGGTATYAVIAETKHDVSEAVAWAKANQLPFIVIGDGSNVIWRDEGFKGLLIVSRLMRFEIFKEDETNYYITIGAGENWDDCVAKVVNEGLTGIESLSLVPGTAGATPVQNVGAYGQEISNTLTTVEAYDTKEDKFVIIPGSECNFSYRSSRFKTSDKHRFIITSITLHLTKGNPMPPFYNSLQNYLDDNGIKEYTPSNIRNAVIAIRNSKLPNPAQIRNVGSFFANPIVAESVYLAIADQYDMVPHWQAKDGLVKLSAAWLIEQCGLKDIHDNETGMGTWPNQALVLVNESAKDTASVLKFRDRIIDQVKSKFGIELIQEPELLP